MGKNEKIDMNSNEKSSDSLREAGKIAGIYSMFGILWILLSDEIVHRVIGENQRLFKQISLYKGWFYILITAMLIFYLIEKRIRVRNNIQKEMNKGYQELVKTNNELSATKEQLQVLAYNDMLTALSNRAFFELKIKELFNNKSEDNAVTMIYFDIDDFKHINDLLGHIVGDEILMKVGKMISNLLEENTFAARLGGDEFAIVIMEKQSEEEILSFVNELLVAINESFAFSDYDLYITISIGIVMDQHHQQSLPVLLKKADTALFYAKENGKNKYAIYAEDMEEDNINYMNTVKELKEALYKDEFMLYYQPKIDLLSGKICGLEALIRWKHSTKGFISPAVFIPIAEKSGVIYDVEDWVFESACKQMKEWTEKGITDVCVSVNLSGKRFLENDLLEKLESVVNDNDLDTNRLHIEITETAVIENFDFAINVLNSLRKIGIRIELDDFGTGYSSLSYLKRLPIDILKIDIEFIRNIATNSEDEAIVKTIISLAHNLDLKVIAEGIETKEQSDILINDLCDMGQGYYFYKPMSPQNVEKHFFGV